MAYEIDLLNQICATLGGTTTHTYKINALNEWCTLSGGTGGHTSNIAALNEIDTLAGGTGAHVYDIRALNSIDIALGGTGGFMYDEFVLVSIGSNVNQIPSKELATLWLDGTIVDVSGSKYFVDKIAGNNVLITGYDFPTGWDKGFPYKSAATIDIFGMTGVPVVSLFQNIDYGNRYFTRHAAQVLDGNGVETYEPRVLDIVAYSAPLTGDDLTAANTYYEVPAEITTAVKWVDTVAGLDTNAGTKAAPWKTIQKANNSSTVNDTIYVKSGIYAETNGSGYLWLDRALVYNAIGKVEVRAASGTARVTYNVNYNRTFNRFIFSNSGGMASVLTLYAANAARATIYNNCKIVSGTTAWLQSSALETVTLNNCIITGSAGTSTSTNIDVINSCLITNHIDYFTKNTIAKNSRFTDWRLTMSTTGTLQYFGNKISASKNALNIINCASILTASIKYNDFIMTASASGFILIDIAENGANYISTQFEYNKISCNATIAGNSTALKAITPDVVVNKNIFNNNSLSEIVLTEIQTATAVEDLINVSNNYYKTNCVNSTVITIGGETNTVRNKGAKFAGNRVIGYLLNNPVAVGTQHACLFVSGGNMVIKHNQISHTTLGLVVKCGNGVAYTSGGIHSNLIHDCSKAIWMRGVGGINVFNNTLYHSGYAYGVAFANLVYADENSAQAGTQESANVIIKNNILHANIGTGLLVGFDTYAGSNGCVVSDNVLRGALNVISHGATNYTTIALAQAAGWAANCNNNDPQLTNMIPATAIAGIDMGVNYNDGLDVATTFGSVTTYPVIVTKQQAATWQKGAYVI